MKYKKNILILALAVFLMGVGLPGVSSAVDVTTECAYTDSDVVCYIYTDTGGASLISGGVNLSYDPAELATPAVTKNDTDWYFGTVAAKHAYMDPETATAGQVVYIVGKLDEGAPTTGVSGTRVLVGTATFARNSTTDPSTDPGGPAEFFGISTGFGRTTGSFVNFVDTTGADMDAGVIFGSTVLERGDANGDGAINVLDFRALRQNIGSADLPVWNDCNADENVDVLDIRCLRQKI